MWTVGSFCLCYFERWWEICANYMCPVSPVTWTSTLVGMSTWPGGSFCLWCFWQVVRRLWSLHVSGIPHHTDLHPTRNVYLTSWFILSVLFLTGGETSVVPTLVWDYPVTGTSTLVGTSSKPAGSFCLCCFWQALRCLWSLNVSRIPCHMDLHPGRNVYLTRWFILSVLFLTGSKTSVVPTHV